MTAPNGPRVQAIHDRLAQILGETVIHAAPYVQEHVQAARASANHDFLEGLEQHTASLVGPILKSVTENSTIPAELTALLTELGVPTEQFTGIISQFFIFGVMFTLAQSMLAPFTQQVQNDIWASHPDRPVDPSVIATAVVRGIGYGDTAGEDIPEWAFTEAAKSGFDKDVFSTMVGVNGMAPALQLLFEMVRRGIIDEGELNGGGTTLISGIQQSDIKDEWIPYISKLRYVQPSPVDFVRAAVQAQMDYATANEWAITVGLEPPDYLNNNPDWFKLLYDTAGRPPGPVEMGHAANRGLTPWDGRGSDSVSFAQAISESDIKDKYIPLLQQLAVYYPPNGEIRTLLMHGGIDDATAVALWEKNGVPSYLADAYLHLAHIEQVTQDKALAKADILTLVQEQAITDDEATTLLAQVGYTGDNAQHLLDMAHFRFELDAIKSAVRKVTSLYVGRKIDPTQAKAALQDIGMPETQITSLLETLTHQRDAEVLIPSASQVEAGFYYGIIDYDTAHSMLVGMGYDTWSAWYVLSVRIHNPIPKVAEPPRPSGGIFGA